MIDSALGAVMAGMLPHYEDRTAGYVMHLYIGTTGVVLFISIQGSLSTLPKLEFVPCELYRAG